MLFTHSIAPDFGKPTVALYARVLTTSAKSMEAVVCTTLLPKPQQKVCPTRCALCAGNRLLAPILQP